MATASTPTRSRSLAEARERVHSPLARLRGYIRTYVSLEGAALLALYLALWFWIGLALDYGFFRLFTIDWVQELPWGFRCGVLAVLAGGLLAAVALKVVTRLFREFRDGALALVLERRFPKLLGDRLITAVELSDPEQAAAYGYSADMVRETIHEAAARVDRLPLKEVFDWKRLYRRGALVVALTAVTYLAVLGGWKAYDAFFHDPADTAGLRDFHEVAGLWFERNILLRDTIWPRRAHLELLDFPAGGEVRIGLGSAPPGIRVRALKYVIAGAPGPQAQANYRDWLTARGEPDEGIDEKLQAFSRTPAEGWRALTWFDLTPELLGADVPAVELPADWAARNPDGALTLDEIELKLDKDETHATLKADAHEALRGALEQLDRRVAQPGMSRKLRKLVIPDQVMLLYKGRSTSSRNTLQKTGDNEYTGQFGDLKESVSFTVQGEDYYTARRYVTVVDPPALEGLVREEERPAYLYYRPAPDGKPEDLHGLKQPFEGAGVSVQGSETSRIDVPAGTNVVLTGTATKELRAVKILPRKAGVEVKVERQPELLDDRRSFRARFQDVRQEQSFLFEFTDTDGVVGLRHVVIRPADDQAPRIKELSPDDIIRKTREGYMVTVSARIPFKGGVEDDHGLADVRYAYTVGRLESVSRVNVHQFYMIGAVPLAAPGTGNTFLSAAYLIGAARGAARAAEPAVPKEVQYTELPGFQKLLKERILKDNRPEVLPMQTVRELLGRKQKEPFRQLLRNFALKPDEPLKPEEDPLGCDFPLWKLNLKVADERQTQPRYRMELWLEAADNDLDSEKGRDGRPRPHTSPSGEKFTFVVVSENELVTEVNKEEEVLYDKLDGMFGKTQENEARLVQTNVDLSSASVKVEDLRNMSDRAERIGEALEKGQRDTREVYLAYERILRELKTNQVRADLVQRIENAIVKPLARVEGEEFERTRNKVLEFRQALDNADLAGPARVEAARKAGAQAKEQMHQLIDQVAKILASMQGLTDIKKLIKMLRDIEEQEQRQHDVVEKIRAELLRKLLDVDKPMKKP
jgi:hypothetical protein